MNIKRYKFLKTAGMPTPGGEVVSDLAEGLVTVANRYRVSGGPQSSGPGRGTW
jgi:hypothetical protein